MDIDTLVKIGNDGKLRTSKYDGTVLFFSDTHVHAYQIIQDMLSCTETECTREFSYKDIMSFYAARKMPFKGGNRIDTFILKVPNDEFYCSMDNVESVDRIINAMRQKMREQKM